MTCLLISYINPITRATVKLPPLPQGEPVPITVNGRLSNPEVFHIGPFPTSTGNPTDPNCTIFVLSTPQNFFGYGKIGDSTMKYIIDYPTLLPPIHEIIFHKGKLYAVGVSCALYVLNEEKGTYCCVTTSIPPSPLSNLRNMYLVEESGTGELLLIEKLVVTTERENFMPMETLSFRFFKLKWMPAQMGHYAAHWVELSNYGIGDHQAPLLTTAESMFVSTRDHNFFKPNCIYFVNDIHIADPLRSFKVYDFKTSN